MHTARTKFIEAESSERIRRALRKKVRSYADVKYESGDKVFYKRKGMKGWRGPANVLGYDGTVVLVRHGTAYYRCHPCHLLKVSQAKKITQKSRKDINDTPGYKKCSSDEQEEATENDATDSGDSDENSGSEEEEEDRSCSENETESQEGDETVDEETSDETVDEETSENMNGSDNICTNSTNTVDTYDSTMLPKPNTFIKYQGADGIWRSAKTLSQQPKRWGRNSRWINIHGSGETNQSSVKWDDIVSWKEIKTHEVLITTPNEFDEEVLNAKDKELKNLKDHDVYEEVTFVNQPFVSSKWVLTEKVRDGKRSIKARLVARGFEEDSGNMKTDSPTCGRLALRLVFVVAATNNWELQSLDISAAFLQGREINRVVYLRPPKDVCSNNVIWKLKRCIYGLNDAPRAWYNRVHDEFIRLGARLSQYDSTLFLWLKKGN